MNKSDKIFVAGHRGMVGAAITALLQKEGYNNLLLRGRNELDLTDAAAVREFFKDNKPDYVILAAAKVGGINANSKYRAEFLLVNTQIQNNVISESLKNNVKKLCFLGSSCIYPRLCPQPIKEEYLMTGPLEPSNEGYALAKIAGYKLCLYYAEQYGMSSISLMPCNLYGTNDDFNLETSHVFSALVKRFADAADEGKDEITLWGSGAPMREFLHADDMAAATVFLMNNYNKPEFINVGSGQEISIKDLALKIAAATGFKGKISWDTSKPDGMPRKIMDVSKLFSLGFRPKISIGEGARLLTAEYREVKKLGRTKRLRAD